MDQGNEQNIHLAFDLLNGKNYNLQVIVCNDIENKMLFYRACSYYKKQLESNKNVVMSFDIEYGQNRIGLMQIKFDLVNPDSDYSLDNDIFLIDPYDFQKTNQEKLILTYFVKEILCSNQIFKVAHGIYSLDFDNIKQQLLCGLSQQYMNDFMYNLLDTRIFSQYMLYKNNQISKYSGNDVYTMYLNQKIIDYDQYKKMSSTEIELNVQKLKGFAIDINGINKKLAEYAVNDVVFLYDSLGLQKNSMNIHTDLVEFKSLCQLLYVLTKLRKDSLQIGKVKYYFDTIRQILKTIDELPIKSDKPTPFSNMFKVFHQFFKIQDIQENKKGDQIIALGNIEQTKFLMEFLMKINLYTDKVPKENNQLIYNLRNNWSELLKDPKYAELAKTYEDFQNKCRKYQQLMRNDEKK